MINDPELNKLLEELLELIRRKTQSQESSLLNTSKRTIRKRKEEFIEGMSKTVRRYYDVTILEDRVPHDP